jgi:hypothetical protein
MTTSIMRTVYAGKVRHHGPKNNPNKRGMSHYFSGRILTTVKDFSRGVFHFLLNKSRVVELKLCHKNAFVSVSDGVRQVLRSLLGQSIFP